MKFNILKIDEAHLSRMQEVLSNSAGYSVSIEDELKYFIPEKSQDWFLINDEQIRPIGFIRSLWQSEEWSKVEFYVSPLSPSRKTIAKLLLDHFLENKSSLSRHKVRIDVLSNDTELNEVIKASKFLPTKTQVFRHFEIRLRTDCPVPPEVFKPSLEHVPQIIQALNNLTPVTTDDVESWLNSDTIRVEFFDNEVTAAAQIWQYGGTCEIVRIATNPKFLRRGFAEKLIIRILNEFSASGVSKVFLKVEDFKPAAISLYNKMGFTESTAQAEIWYSRIYP